MPRVSESVCAPGNAGAHREVLRRPYHRPRPRSRAPSPSCAQSFLSATHGTTGRPGCERAVGAEVSACQQRDHCTSGVWLRLNARHQCACVRRAGGSHPRGRLFGAAQASTRAVPLGSKPYVHVHRAKSGSKNETLHPTTHSSRGATRAQVRETRRSRRGGAHASSSRGASESNAALAAVLGRAKFEECEEIADGISGVPRDAEFTFDLRKTDPGRERGREGDGGRP
jgi:hypothetical protein